MSALVRSTAEAKAFWTLVSVRLAFWLGVAFVFLAYPYRLPPATPRFHVFGWRSDLVFTVFARWDVVWFLRVARDGYQTVKEAAFFPLYPLVVHVVAWGTRSSLVAGVLVSLAASAVAAVLLFKLGSPLVGERAALDAVLYLALFPISFVFTAAYSEGLFLALSAASFLAAIRGRPWLAGVAGALAVLTRMIGIALLPALALILWSQRRSLLRLAPLALLPGALAALAVYLAHQLGDRGALFHAQRYFFGRHRATLGPVGGLWEATSAAARGFVDVFRTGAPAGALNLVYFLLLVAAFALTWVAWRSLGPAFGVYSLAYLAVPLAVPGKDLPLVSFPRFVLGDFPLFLALAAVTVDRPRDRQILLCGFAAIGALAAYGFARDAFIA